MGEWWGAVAVGGSAMATLRGGAGGNVGMAPSKGRSGYHPQSTTLRAGAVRATEEVDGGSMEVGSKGRD